MKKRVESRYMGLLVRAYECVAARGPRRLRLRVAALSENPRRWGALIADPDNRIREIVAARKDRWDIHHLLTPQLSLVRDLSSLKSRQENHRLAAALHLSIRVAEKLLTSQELSGLVRPLIRAFRREEVNGETYYQTIARLFLHLLDLPIPAGKKRAIIEVLYRTAGCRTRETAYPEVALKTLAKVVELRLPVSAVNEITEVATETMGSQYDHLAEAAGQVLKNVIGGEITASERMNVLDRLMMVVERAGGNAADVRAQARILDLFGEIASEPETSAEIRSQLIGGVVPGLRHGQKEVRQAATLLLTALATNPLTPEGKERLEERLTDERTLLNYFVKRGIVVASEDNLLRLFRNGRTSLIDDLETCEKILFAQDRLLSQAEVALAAASAELARGTTYQNGEREQLERSRTQAQLTIGRIRTAQRFFTKLVDKQKDRRRIQEAS